MSGHVRNNFWDNYYVFLMMVNMIKGIVALICNMTYDLQLVTLACIQLDHVAMDFFSNMDD
jgi:isocitrate lyase